MDAVVEEVLHVLIDVASGVRSVVGVVEGQRLHDLVTPPAPPAPEITADEVAAFKAFQASQASQKPAAPEFL